jgi:hypothetical protein
MCPLCIATGTIAFASAGSAGGLGAIAAKIVKVRRKRANQKSAAVDELATKALGELPLNTLSAESSRRWVSWR